MNKHTLLKVGLIGVAASILPLVGASQAFADYAPQAGDVVGVGGDTPQYALQFGADGDYAGDAGYNQAGAYNRLVTFNATADANGRSAYAENSTETSPKALNPTDVLRAGTYPVRRVQSSGAAITALLADTDSPETINFVFSASLPTAAQQTAAATRPDGITCMSWRSEHRRGADRRRLDHQRTVRAVGRGPAEHLHRCLTRPGARSRATPARHRCTIVPLIPPTGSSIYKTFIADLTTANGGTARTLAADVQTVEQNDPTAITGLVAAQIPNAIVPFSQARAALWNDGYFHNPATVFPGGATLVPGVNLLTGTPGDGRAPRARSPTT